MIGVADPKRMTKQIRPWALHRRLRPEDVDAIVAGFRAGQRQVDLAARFGVSRSSVKRILRERGVRR